VNPNIADTLSGRAGLAGIQWPLLDTEPHEALRQALASLLKGYLGEGAPADIIRECLRRARLFHALILVKIVVRRVPLYKKEWASLTARMIERASRVLHERIEV
jgi:hypothetical protein